MAGIREHVRSGGNVDFSYSKEDRERIENTDTKSTREFKDALREWRERKARKPAPLRVVERYGKGYRHREFSLKHKRSLVSKRALRRIKRGLEWCAVILVYFIAFISGLQWYNDPTPFDDAFSQMNLSPPAALREQVASIGATFTREDTLNVTQVEERIHGLVNEERARAGRRAMRSSDTLSRQAREHSEFMLSHQIFEHSGGGNYGENIVHTPRHADVIGCGYVDDEEDIAQCMFIAWRESPGHYANLINRQYSRTGIGVACAWSDCKGTQVFQ